QQLLPTITAAEASAMIKSELADNGRVILATAPQKADAKAPTEADLQASLTSADAVAVTPRNDTTSAHGLMGNPPTAGRVVSRRSIDDVGVTVVTFSNGVQAWLRPTDFKNDQIVFALTAPGGTSLVPPADYTDASLASAYVALSGAGGLKATDL